MKNQCTGRILCSAFAVGASFLLANTVLADKGEVKPQQNSSKGMSLAGKQRVTTRANSRLAKNVQSRKSAASLAIKPAGSSAPTGGIAGTSTCCISNPTPGCDDPVCEASVCAGDPFCCTAQWDAICAGEAAADPNCPQCAAGPCDPANANEECETAIDGGVLATGDSFKFAGTATCAVPDCTLFSGAGQGNVWGKFETLTDGGVDIAYCGSTGVWGNAWLGISEGCPCTSFIGGATFAFDCADGNVTIHFANVPAGVHYYPIMIDPANGSTGSYSVTVTATAGGFAACPNPDHACDQTGTPGCSDEDCCNTVCAADSFCCSVSWDALCVNEAAGFCGGGSTCCFASGGLGCDDPTCQASVCAADPFCCSVAWDGICAQEASVDPNCPQCAPVPCDPANANETCDVATDGGILGPQESFKFQGTATCANPDCNLFSGAGEGNLWVKFETTQTESVKVDYCGSVGVWGNAWLGIAEGCPCASFIGGASFAFSCADGNVQIVFPSVPAGVHYYPIMIDPANGSTGDYSVTITAGGCPPETCPWDNTDNGVVNIDDLLGVINHWGACP